MNKFELIISNLQNYKTDFYGIHAPQPHQYLAIRLVKYLNSQPIVVSVIKDWEIKQRKDKIRANLFYGNLKDAIIESELIPTEFLSQFVERFSHFTSKIKFLFPDRFKDFAKESNIGHSIDFEKQFEKFFNKHNIPEKQDNPIENFKWCIIDIIGSKDYLSSELKWLRSSLNYNLENRVGYKKMLDLFYFYTDPLKSAKLNIYLNERDYLESSLGIIDALIQELQSRSTINYWLERYCQRSQHFNKSFLAEIQNSKGKEINEDLCCQHYLLYLYDKEVEFTYNQHKQGLRPDIELTHSVIEAKLIRKDDSESKLKSEIIKAIREVNLQSKAHSSIEKYILIYNGSENYLILDEFYNEINYMVVDLGIALYDDYPSKSKRKIIQIREFITGDN